VTPAPSPIGNSSITGATSPAFKKELVDVILQTSG
jgi:hypothetical protein